MYYFIMVMYYLTNIIAHYNIEPTIIMEYYSGVFVGDMRNRFYASQKHGGKT